MAGNKNNLHLHLNLNIMPKNSYAEEIKQAEVMSAGLQNNATQVAKRGLDAEFISKLKADLQKAIELNNEQEKLKADLKQKTADLDAKMTGLNAQIAEARKIVKIEFPQTQWKEFGIEAKK